MLCLICHYHLCCMYLCWTGDYNQTNTCFSWSSNRVFFLMNNMMILMLLTVQGDIFQKIATKLNDWFRLKNIKYFLPRVSMFTTYLASVSNHQLACLKSYWCMYAYLNLSKHKRVWQNRILFPYICMWCILTILYISLWLFASRNWSIFVNIIVNSTQI